MKYLGVVILSLGIIGCAYGQQAKPKQMSQDELTAIVSAGAGVGRRVCAAHPQESVWITTDGKTWDKYECSILEPIFKRNGSDLIKTYLEMLGNMRGGSK